MIAALLIGLFVAAGAAPLSMSEAAIVRQVNGVLEAHRELLDLHRGYTGYLEANPAIAKLEAAYAALCREPGFSAVAQAFDEALSQDASAERSLGAYQSPLAEHEAARANVSPWWKALSEDDGELGDRYGVLEQYLAPRPEAGQVWRERMEGQVLASGARPWIRHWHGRVLREPILARRYWPYMEIIWENPELARQTAERWARQYGTAPAWPPKEKPPVLQPLAGTAKSPQAQSARPARKLTRPTRPQHPTVTGPTRPELRTAPRRDKNAIP